jgi:hypothetical protein
MELRKIPLGMFIEILQDLYENGAEFIDLSGNMTEEGDALRDSVKITVRPEYLAEEIDEDEDYIETRIDYVNNDEEDDNDCSLSDDDIEKLM